MVVQLNHQNATGNLYLADCIKGMATALQGRKIDVVITSPPYNLGIKYNTYKDNQPRAEYLMWLEEWASHIKTHLAVNGSLFLNIGRKPTDPYLPHEVIMMMRKHFHLQNEIHWIKSISMPDEDTKSYQPVRGHIKPVPGERFINDAHEFIFHLTNTNHVKLDKTALGVPFKDKSNLKRGNRGSNGDVRCRGNVWFIPYKTIHNRAQQRPHPASFPPDLALNCIKLHGVERTQLVMDPFVGIGNAAAAALALGKDFIGFDIDEYYLSEAKSIIPLKITDLQQRGLV